jgi:hypothetical protein
MKSVMSKQRIEYLKDEHWKQRSALERSSGDMDRYSHFFGIKQLSWMHSMTESEMNNKQSRPAGIFNVRKHFISAPNLLYNINDKEMNPGKVRQI